jgi:hypothetical protein
MKRASRKTEQRGEWGSSPGLDGTVIFAKDGQGTVMQMILRASGFPAEIKGVANKTGTGKDPYDEC